MDRDAEPQKGEQLRGKTGYPLLRLIDFAFRQHLAQLLSMLSVLQGVLRRP